MHNYVEDLNNMVDEFWGRTRRSGGVTEIQEETPMLFDDFNEPIIDQNELLRQQIQSLVVEDETRGDQLIADEERADDPDLETIRKKRQNGCCKKNCIHSYSELTIFNHVLNVCEMQKDQKEAYVMGSISIRHPEKTQTKRGERKQFHCEFHFKDKVICREAFKICYAIGEIVLRNIIIHMKNNGNTPRTHGNRGKKPHNAFNFNDIETIVKFINNYADENGMPFPAPPRGRDEIPIVYLHSSENKRSIHKVYEDACIANEQRAAKYSAFTDIWNTCCGHIKISKPEEDVCGKCEKLRKMITDAHTENEKLLAADAMRDHIIAVKKEKELYKTCITKAKEELSNIAIPSFPAEPLSSDYQHVHVTFDFAQGVSIPHFARQIGALYFLTPRKIQIFGVRFDGFPLQLNYLIDEDQTVGEDGRNVHGPNSVISMLDDALSKYSLGERVLTLHSDNCAGQNKNMYVMAYFAWRILAGLNTEVNLKMQIAGHARCLIDGGFAHIKRQYRRTDVDTLVHLAEVVTKSAYSNRPVLYKATNGSRNWEWRDWKSFLSAHFRSLRGISSYQHFRFSSTYPGKVFLKKCDDDESETTFTLVKRSVDQVPLNRPDPVTPKGLSRDRQKYLFKSVRPYVRPMFQDITCPAPSEE
ncbi:hypothetical protein KUTeg_013580 [Tegillarca granosa]|uniref:DUF7869 domain-containing protein n=1 Tax=Tegillarca granosa TaxID=220873 RepID=A0ABQ9EU39_TEGGR|nr:hypothetical protein KUTeg_013580 [Tegillarca granosa]